MSDLLFKIFGYGSEALIVLTAIVSAIRIRMKNKEYMANKLIGTAFFAIGIYGLAFLIYDLVASVAVIQISYRLGISFLITGVMLLYFGVKVLAHSQFWIKKSKIVWANIIFLIAYLIWIWVSDFIEVIALYPVVNTRIRLEQMAMLILVVYLSLGNALHDIIKYGIKKVKGDVRTRMIVFTIGFALTFLAAIISTISQLVSGIDVYFDIAYFVVFALSMLIMTSGLIGKSKEGKIQNNKADMESVAN